MLQFPSIESLEAHYKKHGPHIGATSPTNYLARANEVLRHPVMFEPGRRGAVKLRNKGTGELVVLDPKSMKLLTYYLRRAYLQGDVV